MVTTRIIDSEPALIVEEERKNLVISDLHIGFEHKFSSNKNTIENNSSIKIDDVLDSMVLFITALRIIEGKHLCLERTEMLNDDDNGKIFI